MSPASATLARQRLGQQLATDLIGRIRSGEIAPGASLPAERELIASYAVGRRTVREAMVVLVTLGLAELRPGRGAIVLTPGPSPERRTAWLVGGAALAELFALRMVLESEAARRAADAATGDELAVLSARQDAYAAGGGDVASRGAADELLHAAVAAAAGSSLHRRLAQAVDERIAVARRRALRTSGWHACAVRDHALVCAAIRERRPELAARHMREHVEAELRAIARITPDG